MTALRVFATLTNVAPLSRSLPMLAFLAHPVVHGALVGWIAAAATDFHAFGGFKAWADVVAFDWRLAIFRWVVLGVVPGTLLALGLGAIGA